MNQKIEKIEVKYPDLINCPVCNHQVYDPSSKSDAESWYSVCPHTLYVAHDEGIEFQSQEFEAAVDGSDAEAADDLNAYELASHSGIEQIAHFESYLPAPTFFGTYVGFKK